MNKSSNKFRHLVWPLVSLALLLLFNAIFTDNFFKIEIKKSDSAQDLIDGVMTCIRGFSGELPPDDDVIMAAIRFQS